MSRASEQIEGSSNFEEMARGRTDLSTFDNSHYDPGGKWIRGLWFLMNAIFLRSPLPGSFWKRSLLRLFGAKVGKGVVIKPRVNIKYPWFLAIGEHAWIGEEAWIDNLGTVSIGPHSCISQGALLICGNHDHRSPSFDLLVQGITLEEGVWIGARAIVGPGVRAGSHAFLTMGSVTAEDLSPYGIYRGDPAEYIRERVIEG